MHKAWQLPSRTSLIVGIACLGMACLPADPAAAKGKRTVHQRPAAQHHVARARPQAPRVLPLVIIDPGHGGLDSGAVGHAGTLEKTVTLAHALELRAALLATHRYRVVLTRDSDEFVPLGDRLAAGRAGAALLISLHADSSPDPRARGASVYIRSQSGTSLQSQVIDSLEDDIRMTASPARAGHLYVLANSSTPGVLVELGFISNRQDEALLKSPKHRKVVAAAIRDAVDGYFAELKHGPRKRT